MQNYAWIIIAIIILLMAIAFFVVSRKQNQKIDYFTLFIMGICWLPLGVILDNYGFSIIGACFMIAGLMNKDKWKTNHRSWSQLNQKERQLKIVVLIGLTVFLIAGIAVFFLIK